MSIEVRNKEITMKKLNHETTMKLILRTFLLVLIVLNVACGAGVLHRPYEASGYNVREMTDNLNNDLAVGTFTRTQSDLVQDPWFIRSLNKMRYARASGHHDFIADAIANELMLAQKLDGQSNLILKGHLLEHKFDDGYGTGVGSIEMAFTLTADGKVLYAQTKRIEHTWDSAFSALAVGQAIWAQLAMIEMLINSLVTDIDFINAVNE